MTRELLDYVERHYRIGKSSIGILNQILPGIFVTISFAPFDPFYAQFDEVLRALFEGGLVQNLLFNNKKMFNEEIPALVLTMEDLGIGFLICVISMAVSIILFFLEIVFSKVAALVENFRCTVVAAYVVVVFMKYFLNHT